MTTRRNFVKSASGLAVLMSIPFLAKVAPAKAAENTDVWFPSPGLHRGSILQHQESIFNMDAVICYAGIVNGNGNIYSEKVLLDAVSKYQSKLAAIGMYGDPEIDFNGDNINLEHASHVTQELKMHKNMLIASVSILETPRGNLLLAALNRVHVGFRMRGHADLEFVGDDSGHTNVKTFEITGINAVNNPYNLGA